MTRHKRRIKTRNLKQWIKAAPIPLSDEDISKLLLENLRQKYSLTRSGK